MIQKKVRKKDTNQQAKVVVDQATNLERAYASILGYKGGKKGGPARAKALTAEQRSAIAKKAAEARWGKK